MLILLDNYDSFTYNIAQYFWELGEDVQVYRNDQITLSEMDQLAPSALCISPGPGRPEQAGITLEAIAHYTKPGNTLPILGVCLGHQALAFHYGASIISAPLLMHGKTSQIEHSTSGIFEGLTNPLQVCRYHSLTVEPASLPACLEVEAFCVENNQKVVMGIRHRSLPLWGVQFHPESILSQEGLALFKNFLILAKSFQ